MFRHMTHRHFMMKKEKEAKAYAAIRHREKSVLYSAVIKKKLKEKSKKEKEKNSTHLYSVSDMKSCFAVTEISLKKKKTKTGNKNCTNILNVITYCFFV